MLQIPKIEIDALAVTQSNIMQRESCLNPLAQWSVGQAYAFLSGFSTPHADQWMAKSKDIGELNKLIDQDVDAAFNSLAKELIGKAEHPIHHELRVKSCTENIAFTANYYRSFEGFSMENIHSLPMSNDTEVMGMAIKLFSNMGISLPMPSDLASYDWEFDCLNDFANKIDPVDYDLDDADLIEKYKHEIDDEIKEMMLGESDIEDADEESLLLMMNSVRNILDYPKNFFEHFSPEAYFLDKAEAKIAELKDAISKPLNSSVKAFAETCLMVIENIIQKFGLEYWNAFPEGSKALYDVSHFDDNMPYETAIILLTGNAYWDELADRYYHHRMEMGEESVDYYNIETPENRQETLFRFAQILVTETCLFALVVLNESYALGDVEHEIHPNEIQKAA